MDPSGDTVRVPARSNCIKEETELHKAAREGNLEDLKNIVSRGNVDLERECYGWTPLYCACVAGHTDVVEFLLDAGAQITGAKISCNKLVLDSDDSTSESEDSEILVRVKWIWEPVLLAACSRGPTSLVKILLEKGASLETANEDDITPLHVVCYKYEANPELVSLLLSYGANVSARDVAGSTPLFGAVIKGHSRITKLLINAGANVNDMNYSGKTPLHFAVTWSCLDVARVLLEHGADVNARDMENQTPLQQYCLPPPEMIMLLLDYDAGEAECCKTGCRCGSSVIECCYNYGRYIHSSYSFAGFEECTRDLDLQLQTFELYWTKMRVMGMTLDSTVETVFETNDRCKQCKDELNRMMTETVNNTNVAYRHIWKQRPAALQQVKSLDIDEIYEKFPIYSEIIRRRYVIGRQRLPFLEKARVFFSSLPVQSLLPECVDEILAFLSQEDLQNLVSIVTTASEISNCENQNTTSFVDICP